MAFYVVERKRGLAGGGITDAGIPDPGVPVGGSTVISQAQIQRLQQQGIRNAPRPDQLTTEAYVAPQQNRVPTVDQLQWQDPGAEGLPSWVKWAGLGLLVLVGGVVVYKIVT